MPCSTPRRRSRPDRSSVQRNRAARRTGHSQAIGEATPSTGFHIRDVGFGRLPFRQSEFTRRSGDSAPLRPGESVMTLQPLPAAKALDNYFLEARAKLLDLAAILDR